MVGYESPTCGQRTVLGGTTQRQFHGKDCPCCLKIRGGEPASMLLDNAPADGQTETCSPLLIRDEGFEQAGHDGRRNAWPGVAKFDVTACRSGLVTTDGDLQAAAVRHGLDAVE